MAANRKPSTTGTPGWVRLGKLLQERRERELDPRFYNRDAFAAERGVNLRLAQELELNRRENITPVTLRDVIAPGYQVTFESLLAVRDEVPGADLEAAPGSPRRRAPRPAHAVAPPRPDGGGWLPPISDQQTQQAQPYYDEIWLRLGRYALGHPGSDAGNIPGAALFPDDDFYARAWDRSADMTVQQRVWLVAVLLAGEAVRQRETGTG